MSVIPIKAPITMQFSPAIFNIGSNCIGTLYFVHSIINATIINEKYKIENQLTDIKVVHIPNVRLRNIIKPYILPLSIVSIITIVFAMIAFRKLGVLRAAYEMAISIVAPQAILASFYAVTRIPVNRLTTIIAIMIFIISITLPMVKLDKEKEDKLNKDKKYNKI